MGTWILAGDVGGMERAVLVDSATERPINLSAFEDSEAAESFLAFAERRGVGDDLRRLSAVLLDELHAAWSALPKCQQCGQRVVQPGELPNECEACRPACDWSAGTETCDARGTELIKTETPLSLDRYCAFHAVQVRRQKAKARQ